MLSIVTAHLGRRDSTVMPDQFPDWSDRSRHKDVTSRDLTAVARDLDALDIQFPNLIRKSVPRKFVTIRPVGVGFDDFASG